MAQATPDQMLNLLPTEEPETCRLRSAEINGLLAYGLQPGDHLVFIHSDTPEGTACAGALKAYFEAQAYDCELVRIDGLTYSVSDTEAPGLRSLFYTVAQAIVKAAANGVVVLHLTGGFKVEMAICLALACMMPNVEAGYLHEEMKTWLRLPTLPLCVEMDRLAPFFPLLSAVSFLDKEAAPRRSSQSVNAIWRTNPTLADYLFVVDGPDGRLQLTGFGQMVSAINAAMVTHALSDWRSPPRADEARVRVSHPDSIQQFLRALEKNKSVASIQLKPRRVDETSLVMNQPFLTVELRVGDYEAVVELRTTAEDELQMELVKASVIESLRECSLLV